MENKIKPNFFIVGAAKAGTTSLFYYLNQHPQIYLSPVKEPNFFATDIDLNILRTAVKKRLHAQNTEKFISGDMKGELHRAYIRDKELYMQLFRFAGDAKAIGESSVSYLYSTTAAVEIHKHNPEAKIIIMLREPSSRAYSHYLMDRKLGFTDLSFKSAYEQDKKLTIKGWGASSLYYDAGLYYQQVKRYLDIFTSSQVKIILFDDFKSDTIRVIKDIYNFLEVDVDFHPETEKKFNEAVIPRNKLSEKLLRMNTLRIKLRQVLKDTWLGNSLKRIIFTSANNAETDKEFISSIKKDFREDIVLLSKLIDRDLNIWLRN